jgi:hypothetical protein
MSRLGPKAFYRVYSEHPMILLPKLEFWVVSVQPQFLDEVLKTPDEDLSFSGAVFDVRLILDTVKRDVPDGS